MFFLFLNIFLNQDLTFKSSNRTVRVGVRVWAADGVAARGSVNGEGPAAKRWEG